MPPPRPDPLRPDRGDAGSPARATLKRALLVVVCFLIGLGILACLRPLELVFAILQVKLSVDGIHSRYVNLDGYRIHYFEGGSGPPILLIHGLGSRAEDWADLMPQLVN